MPLPHRMQLTPKIQIPSSDSPLQSQPLSPTKLKVSRQASKSSTCPTPKVIELPPLPVEEVCLRWNSHHSNMQTSFPHLLQMEKYVDVTLIAEGKTLKCHRMILSSCSPYFEEILSEISPLQHPVIILNGVPFWILKMLTDFMYIGEVNIDQNKVPELLDIAEVLKVKGLASKNNSVKNDKVKKENCTPLRSADRTNISKQFPNIYSPNTPILPKTEELPINDPLQLLETKFLEVPSSKSKDYRPFPKKIVNKKLRKRKSSDEESSPSPPVFPIRRGTRSRPYVKVPKYYDYEDIVKPIGAESPQDTLPFSPVHIKSEPVEPDENESQSANETPLPSSIVMSEYTDINDIANKLQSLDKSLDIQPITPLVTKPQSKPITYKIKIKSLSSMSEKTKKSASLKDGNDGSELLNMLLKTTSKNKGESESTKQTCDTSGTNNINPVEIVPIGKTDHTPSDVGNNQDATLQGSDNDK